MNYYRESTIRAALKQFFSELDAAAAMRAIEAEARKDPEFFPIIKLSEGMPPHGVEIIKCHECRYFKNYDGYRGEGWERGVKYGKCYKNAVMVRTHDFCSRAEWNLPDYDDHTVSGLLDD